MSKKLKSKKTTAKSPASKNNTPKVTTRAAAHKKELKRRKHDAHTSVSPSTLDQEIAHHLRRAHKAKTESSTKKLRAEITRITALLAPEIDAAVSSALKNPYQPVPPHESHKDLLTFLVTTDIQYRLFHSPNDQPAFRLHLHIPAFTRSSLNQLCPASLTPQYHRLQSILASASYTTSPSAEDITELVREDLTNRYTDLFTDPPTKEALDHFTAAHGLNASPDDLEALAKRKLVYTPLSREASIVLAEMNALSTQKLIKRASQLVYTPFATRSDRFSRGGLHCEKIFGPTTPGSCFCRNLSNEPNPRLCTRCMTLTGPSASRSTTSAVIQVMFPFSQRYLVPVISPALRPLTITDLEIEISSLDLAYTRLLLANQAIAIHLTPATPKATLLAAKDLSKTLSSVFEEEF